MCGLVGIASSEVAAHVAGEHGQDAAMAALSHRGLDGLQGTWYGEFGWLGHVRLPILDTNPCGQGRQPKEIPHGAVGYVGEIHNHYIFGKQRCDTEAVARIMSSGSPASELVRCDGFWSIAHMQERFPYTMLYVDYLGQKPMYLWKRFGAFASELGALLALFPDDKPKLDQVYLANVRKWGYDPTGRTPYVGIKRLPPGSMTTLYDGALKSASTYFPLQPAVMTPTADTIARDLAVAVSRRLLSDVPIGILLSGGLDSTIVATLAASALKGSGRQLRAFYVDNDEAKYARIAADYAGLELEELDVSSAMLKDDPWVAHKAYGEPVDLGSVVPQYALGQALKAKGIHVALSGDGADELFGGYRRAMVHDTQMSDIMLELPHYHLPRLDTLMMRGTVELRCPFLAPYVVQSAMKVPYTERRGKKILKEAFPDLPKEILERDKKPLRTHDPNNVQHREEIIQAFIQRH